VPELISVSEAARIAGRSRPAIHSWISQGLVDIAFKGEGPNGMILLDRDYFERILPDLLAEMNYRLQTKTPRGAGKQPKPKRGGADDSTES
jgi:hypothetical protein